MIIPDKVKQMLGVSPEVEVTMYDVAKKSIDVQPKIRFIYLMSLFEGFIKEYICNRTMTDIDKYRSVVNAYDSDWDLNHKALGARSSLNLNYALYLLDNLFGVKVSDRFSDITYEIGAFGLTP
ncbi:hypothetical protein ABEZ21_23925 [Brevibacillus porteri]|nr:hypothetical protein [Brevibacillus porteri]MED1803070.1 hypothetical protein [Brevibacillus porteri]MED2135336.1 hypothetical protein [Brevibacillus porteri]MED2748756.1 hypothetical protein [Brevibacillus porteri]MED2818414.1 hypothetical protein [Brevibacillus porteri]MED4899566.1 hypothetical protein [Brevibacillus porteri]